MMQDDKVDRAAKDSFPASDAPANSGIVGPRTPEPEPEEHHEETRPKGTDERGVTEPAHRRGDQNKPRQR